MTDVTPVSDHPVAVAIAPGGQILVAGTNGDFGTSSTAGDFLLVRYTPDGILDSAFGNGGVVITDVARRQDIVSAMLVQPDGKVVLAGYDTIGFQGLAASAQHRARPLRRRRELDRSFGSDGIVLTDFPSSPSEWVTSAALQPDGGIIVRAVSRRVRQQRFRPPRYTGTGAIDDTFGGSPPVARTASTSPWPPAADPRPRRRRRPVRRQRLRHVRFNPDGRWTATSGTAGGR